MTKKPGEILVIPTWSHNRVTFLGAMSLRWFSGSELETLMSPSLARLAIHRALQWQHSIPSMVTRTQVESAWGPLLLMPLVLPSYTVIKVLAVRPHQATSLPGALILLDTITGEPQAVMDGATVTGLRTGALAAVATEMLAFRCTTVAIIGAGYQARFHIRAMADLPGVSRIRLYNRTSSRARTLQTMIAPSLPVSVDVADTVAEVTHDADVITLITGSGVPLIDRAMVTSSVHINAMGAYLPDRRECASDVLVDAEIFADRLDEVLQHAGDVIIPIREGSIRPDNIHALAELEHAPVPTKAPRLTLFKSIGSAEFDAFFAITALEQARQTDTANDYNT